MKKGIGILIPGILIMLAISILAALFFFGEKVIIEKRSLQEKILAEGNRLELTGKSIQMAADLATLQAIKDIGQGYVVKSDTSIKYNPTEKLPYWHVVPEEEIEESIKFLSASYFKNYFEGYEDFFENPETSRGRHNYWNVNWQQDVSTAVFNNQKISINFGVFKIDYKEPKTNPLISISKEFPIISNINTNFVQLLDVSQQVIDKIKSGETSIANNLGTIKIEMEDKGDYIKVFVYENKEYTFYDIPTNSQKKEYIGVRFLVDKNTACYCATSSCSGGCWWGSGGPYLCSTTKCSGQPTIGTNINDLNGLKQCGSEFVVIFPNNNFDICSIMT